MTTAVQVPTEPSHSPPSLWNAFKVFSKLYNAVYCSKSKKPDQDQPVTSGPNVDIEEQSPPLPMRQGQHQEEQGQHQEEQEQHQEEQKQHREEQEQRQEEQVQHREEQEKHREEQQDQEGQEQHQEQRPDGWDCTEQWFQAVSQEDADTVQQLLRQGAVDVNTMDQNNWSALHISAWNGYTDLCNLLLTAEDIDINLPGPGGCTPLSLASQCGHFLIVERLLSAHCDVQHTATLGDSADVSPLHLAVQHGHADVVKRLLDAGAVVNASMTVKGVKGVTPLHLAVETDQLEVMDMLIEAGCNVHISTQSSDDTAC